MVPPSLAPRRDFEIHELRFFETPVADPHAREADRKAESAGSGAPRVQKQHAPSDLRRRLVRMTVDDGRKSSRGRIEIEVLEETNEKAYLVIPVNRAGIPDDQLDVAGGWDSYT